jgi:hypothetical protein
MEKDDNGNIIYKDNSVQYNSSFKNDNDGYEHKTMKIHSEKNPICGDMYCGQCQLINVETLINELINNGRI